MQSVTCTGTYNQTKTIKTQNTETQNNRTQSKWTGEKKTQNALKRKLG